MRPNCTDAARLMTQPARLTHVNRRPNPRHNGRAYGNYWPQPKRQCSRSSPWDEVMRYRRLPGERRSLNGELMRLGERGNPDHSPDQQHRSGRQTARGADGCGEWEDAKSEGLPVMGGIPVATLPAGATLADVHLVYERKKSR